MPESIRDGEGNGHLVGVTTEHRMKTDSIVYSGEHHANHLGNAYNFLFDVTPTGAGDCFVYIKNSSDTDMVLEGIWIRVGSAEQVETRVGNTGTPSGGVAVVPVSLNSGSSSAAEGTFQAGNDITGLGAGTIFNKWWWANTATTHFNFEQDFILPTNSVFTCWATTGGINIAGTVALHYHTDE